MTDFLQYARDLIAIESITGNEEPVAVYLEDVLKKLGFPVRSQAVEPGRRNLIAGPEHPRVIFCTHMDTVPPYIPLREDGEYIYGRGACDTKGIIASMLEAGRRLREDGISDIGFLFVVGEEVDNVGAHAANESVRAEYIVVGEPTEEQIAIAHKGCFVAHVEAQGVACHSAYPHLGDSAVHRLLVGLNKVLETDFGTDDVLGPATVNIGHFDGGVAPNVLAPRAKAVVAIRVVSDIEELEKRFRTCFTDPDTGEPEARVAIDVRLRMKPLHLEGAAGFPETVVAYGTDTPFLLKIGKPLLYGPGSIHDAHTDGEKIEKAAMVRAVDAYVRLGRELGR